METVIQYPEQDVVTLNRTGVSVSYIGESYRFGKFESSDGTILYSSSLDTDWAESGQELYPLIDYDEGFQYILTNGYPNHALYGNRDVDRYITQVAIWYYDDGESFSDDFWDAADPYGLKDYIFELVDTAQEAAEGSAETDSVVVMDEGRLEHVESDFSTLRSPKITVDTDSDEPATVSIDGIANSAEYIVDEQGDHRNQFNDGESFYIEVPLTDCLFSGSLDVSVSADATVQRAVEYRTSLEGNYERLVGLKEMPATVTSTFSLSMSTEIMVIDAGIMLTAVVVAVSAAVVSVKSLLARKKAN